MRLLPLAIMAAICPLLAQETALRGFPANQWRVQHEWEERAHRITSAARAGEFMKRLSAEPHHAGSQGSRAVANYALQLLQSWGYQASIETFEGLMPYPTHRQVEILMPVKFRARLEEPSIKVPGIVGGEESIKVPKVALVPLRPPVMEEREAPEVIEEDKSI